VERLSFEITGLKDIPEYKELPSTPSYSMFDSASWETKIVEREENKID
ncbi:TPA: molybdopterin biosynthesis protein MoeB, partial [Staphylococcus aureus]|nr:molybdopterin biosynthesis protein MoeB [Staphylococcus aureus]